MDELISIIMPTFNRCNIIDVAIQSVIDQTYKHWELLIIDDYGTDNTEKHIKEKYNRDHRIKYIKNDYAKGPAGARNYGIFHAQGTYIAFLDSDDVWIPQHLENAVVSLKYWNKDVFFGNWINEDVKKNSSRYIHNDSQILTEVIQKIGINLANNEIYYFKCEFIEYMTINMTYFYHINTLVIKKSVIDEVGIFNEELLASEDLDFTSRCIERYGFLYDLKPQFIYRIGNDNIYNFVEHSKLTLDKIINDDKMLNKLVLCDKNKCMMLKARKDLIKRSNYVLRKKECYLACNKKLSVKYLTLAMLIQKDNKYEAFIFAIKSIIYEFNWYKIGVLFRLLLKRKKSLVKIDDKYLNFI